MERLEEVEVRWEESVGLYWTVDGTGTEEERGGGSCAGGGERGGGEGLDLRRREMSSLAVVMIRGA